MGACIPGSTPAGGHKIPSDLASLSPRGSLTWPVVLSRGTIELAWPLSFGSTCVGAQAADASRGTFSPVTAGGGIVEDGGACASAEPDAIRVVKTKSSVRLCMGIKCLCGTVVPCQCGSLASENAPDLGQYVQKRPSDAQRLS